MVYSKRFVLIEILSIYFWNKNWKVLIASDIWAKESGEVSTFVRFLVSWLRGMLWSWSMKENAQNFEFRFCYLFSLLVDYLNSPSWNDSKRLSRMDSCRVRLLGFTCNVQEIPWKLASCQVLFLKTLNSSCQTLLLKTLLEPQNGEP